VSNQKQVTTHTKFTQARSILNNMVRDNIQLNDYVYKLAAKCGIKHQNSSDYHSRKGKGTTETTNDAIEKK
jgi:hypothetical protein